MRLALVSLEDELEGSGIENRSVRFFLASCSATV